VHLVKTAIGTSTVDFGVPAKAVRTLAEQKALLAQGVTKTLKSKHLVHDDGFGWAVDLVPYIGGKFTWDDTEPFFEIAETMRDAAALHLQDITWGAVWDRVMKELPEDLHLAVTQYALRHPGPDFLDYPHFQLGHN